MAGIAWELAALAFIANVLEVPHRVPVVPAPDPVMDPPLNEAANMPDVAEPDPLSFIDEPGDPGARYYRLTSEDFDGFAAVYSDGRVRIADTNHRRFAGALENGRADVLQLGTETWSEVAVQTTPAGETQFELRGDAFGSLMVRAEPLLR